VINKADIDSAASTRAEAQITSSLRAYGRHAPKSEWNPEVMQMSALQSIGIDGFWELVQKYQTLQSKNGKLAARRESQALAWMWEQVNDGLKAQFYANVGVRMQLASSITAVANGSLAASTAARQLLALASGH
jgi:LAO/AO transport system kinase